MLADLHVHTTASDGDESPLEVVARASSLGLKALAITDHDTLEGIPQALEEGRRMHIDVLPGIELSTVYDGREVHMLGYLIDINCEVLLDRLVTFRNARLERAVKMVNRLCGLGFPITYSRVREIAGYGSVGRVHVARALVEAGMVKSVEEAFNLYIGEGRPGYEPRLKCTPEEAVQLIRLAGGVAVLAHPGLSEAGELIRQLIPQGLQGVEVYHPGHSPLIIQHYLEICRQYRLVATGGSDYHGLGGKKHNSLGSITVDYRVVGEIRDIALLNRKLAPGNGS